MKYANRINKIESFDSKRWPVEIGLDDLHGFTASGVLLSDFHRWSQIDSANFGTVLGRVMSETTVATSGIQDFLAMKEFSLMRLHIIEKRFLPLTIHFRKTTPFETKTKRGSYLHVIPC